MNKNLVAVAIAFGLATLTACGSSDEPKVAISGATLQPTTSTTAPSTPTTEPVGSVTTTSVVTLAPLAPQAQTTNQPTKTVKAQKPTVTTTSKATKAPKTATPKATPTPKPPKTTTPKPAPKPPASVTINKGDPVPNIHPPTKLNIRGTKSSECALMGGTYESKTGICRNVDY